MSRLILFEYCVQNFRIILYIFKSRGDNLFSRIHQVRSYGSNLAVNIWWKHHLTEDIDFGRCNDPCDLEFTLAEVDFGGFTQTFSDPEEIR